MHPEGVPPALLFTRTFRLLRLDLRCGRANRRFPFQKRSQLFIRVHNVAFTVAAMRTEPFHLLSIDFVTALLFRQIHRRATLGFFLTYTVEYR
jgi:hypothetical protein